ncbi:MAG TPA: response regulator transcription factor, partial [Chthoniobacterales bacterium]|nr:response regulator transcription factor [Chthoniobacterales bacterium]
MNAKQYDLVVEAFSRRKFLRAGSAVLAARARGRAGKSLTAHNIRRRAYDIEAMTKAETIVRVVDDDVSIRESLKSLIRSVGLRVQVFASAEEFLRTWRPDVPGCLVLDVQLPGLSGFDLQSRMAEIAMEIPIIFITGHGDIPMSVQAMKAGAMEFLIKPFDDQDLIEAIQQGIERDRAARRRIAKLTEANEALRG